MRSTTNIIKFTPAVLKAVCERQKISKKEYRLNTLRRIHQELSMLIEKEDVFSGCEQETLRDLDNEVRLALGEE